MEKINFFNEFNTSSKEITIGENYFNNSYEFVILEISGLIDTYNSDLFLKNIKEFLKKTPRKVCIIEMSGINYMSSTGIGAFVELLKFCNENKIIFYMMNIGINVDEVFSLLGFKSFFNYIKELKDISDEKIQRSIFPAKIQCPHCSTELMAKKIGSFKCSKCSSIFRVIEKNEKIIIEKRN